MTHSDKAAATASGRGGTDTPAAQHFCGARSHCSGGRRVAPFANLLIAALLAGCTVGPDFAVPDWASPVSWFAGPKEKVKAQPSLPVAEPIDPNWWILFRDGELTALA